MKISDSLNNKGKYFLMSFYSCTLRIFFYIKLEKSFFFYEMEYIYEMDIYIKNELSSYCCKSWSYQNIDSTFVSAIYSLLRILH